jgi:hypothetical protein
MKSILKSLKLLLVLLVGCCFEEASSARNIAVARHSDCLTEVLSQYHTGFRYIIDVLDFKDKVYSVRANEKSTNYAISQLYERTSQANKEHQFKLSALWILKFYLGTRYTSTDSCITKLMQNVIDESKPSGIEDAVFLGRSIWELQLSGIKMIKARGNTIDFISYTPLNLESNFYPDLMTYSIQILLPVDKDYIKNEIIPVMQANKFGAMIPREAKD